jgi:hypothetical protein
LVKLKPDFPALFAPGIHQENLSSIESVAVLPFSTDVRRSVLFNQLDSWIKELRAINLSARIWIDGSFLTEKPSPDDIDCVIWTPRFTVQPTNENYQRVSMLFDKAAAKINFNIDLYVEDPIPDGLLHREAYWKGFFGYCHDRVTAKGFVELII